MIDVHPLLPLVGWRERVALPGLGIPRLKAKLDTGARSSALHVESLEVFRRGGGDWLRFGIAVGLHHARCFSCEARATDRRRVFDSSGRASERWFIETEVTLGSLSLHAEISLTDRRGMRFPMLLGRTALAGRVLVDPARSYTLSRPTSARSPR